MDQRWRVLLARWQALHQDIDSAMLGMESPSFFVEQTHCALLASAAHSLPGLNARALVERCVTRAANSSKRGYLDLWIDFDDEDLTTPSAPLSFDLALEAKPQVWAHLNGDRAVATAWPVIQTELRRVAAMGMHAQHRAGAVFAVLEQRRGRRDVTQSELDQFERDLWGAYSSCSPSFRREHRVMASVALPSRPQPHEEARVALAVFVLTSVTGP
jgi:hypothetical protein